MLLPALVISRGFMRYVFRPGFLMCDDIIHILCGGLVIVLFCGMSRKCFRVRFNLLFRMLFHNMVLSNMLFHYMLFNNMLLNNLLFNNLLLNNMLFNNMLLDMLI